MFLSKTGRSTYITNDGKYIIMKLDRMQKYKWGIFVFNETNSMYCPLIRGIDSLDLAKKTLENYILDIDKQK